MSFFSGSTTTKADQAQEIMNKIQQELALANAQELISKINEKCYDKCVPKPGARLDSNDQCIEKYVEAWNVVSKTYLARMQKENQK